MISSMAFFMSVLWSSGIILGVHFLRKKQFFLNGFGMSTVVLLYLFCIGRMLVVLEFPFTQVVELPGAYSTFFRALCLEKHRIGQAAITVFDMFLLLWGITTALLCGSYLFRYIRSMRRLRQLSFEEDGEAEQILLALRERYSDCSRIRVVRCAAVSMPMGVGLLKRVILLPTNTYAVDELQHILLHEFIHFKNNDLWTKLLVEVFCRLYWWNPLVYLLKADVEQMLELKCDMHATVGISALQRAAYLRTITACLQKSDADNAAVARFSTKLFRWNNARRELIERFRLVAYPVSKNGRKFQVLSIVCFTVLLITSYLFVLQPGYVPQEETGVFYLEDIRLSGYIVKHWDDRYTLYNDDGRLIPLNEETAELLKENGFDMIER